MDASRVIVCSPTDALLFELSPDELWACDESLEINGPHQLDIVTTRVLTKEQRIVVFDEGNHAHEYVVASEDREHANGSIPYGTYKCPWSLQHDARLWKVDTDVGITTPVQASVALEAVLSGTNRWVAGTVTLATTGSAELHRMSGWKALETVIGIWGGEVDAEVTVSTTGITQRRVMLYAQMGNQTAKRRFDYQRDLESIQRHVLSDDVACRIIPLGKGSTNEYDVEEKVDITSVNDDVEWLQNDESAAIYRMKGPSGSYEYPVVYVENSDMETPADLKAWGLSVLEEYTVPKVEYEMEVTYLYHKDYNPHGVNLGDVIQCVDHGFGDTPLRLEARVTGMKIDRLDRSRSTVKITNVKENRSLTSSIASVASLVNEIAIVSGGTAEYLNHLLDNLNKEINARGGYVYITDGQGLRTYDKAVNDPLTGYTADYVTEMKGGSLRFAHEKENGEWKWTTVITPEGYLGLAATIAQITSGLIRSSDGRNYWNLDNGQMRMSTDVNLAGRTLGDLYGDVYAEVTDVEIEYVLGDSASTEPTEGWAIVAPSWDSSKYLWTRTMVTMGNGVEIVYAHTQPEMINAHDNDDNAQYTQVRKQYYVSDSCYEQAGGEWSYNKPSTFDNGGYVWTRSEITWAISPSSGVTYTTPTLAASLLKSEYNISVFNGSLDQTEIFKRLTNNGQWRGIYTDSNGDYYINASYINTGYLGNINSGNYWNLATGELRLTTSTEIGVGSTIQDIIDAANATITSVDVEYAQGTSSTTAPTTGWGTNPPAWEAGKYIWSRTATTSGTGTSASTSYSTPVMISGKDGGSGTGIVTIREQYYLSSSSSTQTGGSWSYNQPVWSNGKYIWTRSEITWDTNPQTTTYTDPILAAALTQANKNVYDLDHTTLNRDGIFARLTRDGAWQGFFTDTNTGEYYINATYITAGNLNADLIRAGKIQSVNGKVYFDLTNNELHCDKLVSTETNTSSNFSASIKSKAWTQSTTVYGLLLENSIDSDGTILIRPGAGDSTNMNSMPTMQCKEGLYFAGGGSIAYLADYGVDLYPLNTSSSDYSEIQLRRRTSSTSSEYDTYDMFFQTGNNCKWFFCHSGELRWAYYTPTISSLMVSGSKNRVVDTENYGKRLLNSYETPAPMFGDVGSAVIGDDGVCVVLIDDIFQETSRTDMAYQVFLQKCGRGDLWVSEKTPTYFTVEGTANLQFDWHLMAHQSGFELQRLDDKDRRDDTDVMGYADLGPIDSYSDELNSGDDPFSVYEDEMSSVYNAMNEAELLY